MKSAQQLGEEIFRQRFDQIEGIVHAVARQKRLGVDESQELYSRVMLKVVPDDYAALRSFRGGSRWGTYLTVIIQRVLLDYRVQEWGRWRPCARTRRLGPTAVELDRRINRDGLEPAEVVRDFLARGVDETADELERFVDQIPRRPRRCFVSAEASLRELVDPGRADQRFEAAERQRTATRLSAALASELRQLPDQERILLGLRFNSAWTVRRIAASQNLEERPLYRRFERILRRLRHRLERLGLGWGEVATALQGADVDLKIGLR